MIRFLSHSLLVGVLTLGGADAVGAQTPTRMSSIKTSERLNDLMSKACSKARLSVVQVKTDGQTVALGTVIQSDGFIVTKASEVRKPEIKVELPDGRNFEAKVVAKDDSYDIMLLKIEADELTPVEWTLSHSATVGSFIACVGVSKKPAAIGVLSVASRNLPPITRDDILRTPPQNSGVMGVFLDENTDGVFITGYPPDGPSPAKKAGIQVNDYIIGVNDKTITSRQDLQSIVQQYKAGDTITVKLRRSGETKQISLTLAKRGANIDRSDFQNKMGSVLSDRRIGFPTVVQHDAVVRPADCGAPLVDIDGKVIGINIARAGRTESYAIPSEALLPLLPSLLAGKSVDLGFNPGLASVSPAELLQRKKDEMKKLEQEQSQLDRKLRAAREELARVTVLERNARVASLEELPKPKKRD